MNKPFQVLIHTNLGTNDIYDVSTLAHNIQHSTFLHGSPGKLSFILEKDPKNILEISLGYGVSFRYDGKNVFYGYIFKIGTDRTEAYQVTAYDQLRYFANHDYLNCVDMSLVDLFETICSRTETKPYSIKSTKGRNKIRDKHFCDVSYFDMMKYAIDDYMKVYKGKNRLSKKEYFVDDYRLGDFTRSEVMENYMFFVRDNFGTLELHEVSEKYMDDSERNGGALIIGTGSLLLDYKYDIDIDSNTYTQILAICNTNKKTDDGNELNTRHALKPDGTSDISYFDVQKRYGILRKVVNVKNVFANDDEFNKELNNYCELFLDVLNKPSKTAKLDALGVTGLNAGDCFVFQLDKLNVKQSVYITSATHNYDADMHTMSLEIAAIDNMPETLGRT